MSDYLNAYMISQIFHLQEFKKMSKIIHAGPDILIHLKYIKFICLTWSFLCNIFPSFISFSFSNIFLFSNIHIMNTYIHFISKNSAKCKPHESKSKTCVCCNRLKTNCMRKMQLRFKEISISINEHVLTQSEQRDDANLHACTCDIYVISKAAPGHSCSNETSRYRRYLSVARNPLDIHGYV